MVAITDERLHEVLCNNDKYASFKLTMKMTDQDHALKALKAFHALKIPSSFNLLLVLSLWMY